MPFERRQTKLSLPRSHTTAGCTGEHILSGMRLASNGATQVDKSAEGRSAALAAAATGSALAFWLLLSALYLCLYLSHGGHNSYFIAAVDRLSCMRCERCYGCLCVGANVCFGAPCSETDSRTGISSKTTAAFPLLSLTYLSIGDHTRAPAAASTEYA